MTVPPCIEELIRQYLQRTEKKGRRHSWRTNETGSAYISVRRFPKKYPAARISARDGYVFTFSSTAGMSGIQSAPASRLP